MMSWKNIKRLLETNDTIWVEQPSILGGYFNNMVGELNYPIHSFVDDSNDYGWDDKK